MMIGQKSRRHCVIASTSVLFWPAYILMAQDKPNEGLVSQTETAIKVTPTPTPTPTPSATVSPLPLPTAKPTPVPEAKDSPFFSLTGPVQIDFSKIEPQKFTDTQKQLAVESEGNEQVVTLSQNGKTAIGDTLFYQKRSYFQDAFTAYIKDFKAEKEGRVTLNMPHIFDAFVNCPASQEIVFQEPSIDAKGKFIPNGRAKRLYIYSFKTGSAELIWKRAPDQNGTLSPFMSATPDCKHILVNLQLEEKKSKYGELMYIRKPEFGEGKQRNIRAEEWSFKLIAETPRNGYYVNFSDAAFLQPANPEFYKPDSNPPPVIAVRKKPEGKSSEVFVFNSKGPTSQKAYPAASWYWQRTKLNLPNMVNHIWSPSFYNASKQVFFLYDTQVQNDAGQQLRGVGAFDLSGDKVAFKNIIRGDHLNIKSMNIDPSGSRIALSYVKIIPAATWQNSTDKRSAGLIEIKISDKSEVSMKILDSLVPFHGLSKIHDPRPIYSSDGSYLYYSLPEITEFIDLQRVAPDASVDSELQFPVKLWKRKISGN